MAQTCTPGTLGAKRTVTVRVMFAASVKEPPPATREKSGQSSLTVPVSRPTPALRMTKLRSSVLPTGRSAKTRLLGVSWQIGSPA